MGYVPDTIVVNYPHAVTLTKYVDPRMVDEQIYGHFRYEKRWDDGVPTYIYRFKTEPGAAKFKKDYTSWL